MVKSNKPSLNVFRRRVTVCEVYKSTFIQARNILLKNTIKPKLCCLGRTKIVTRDKKQNIWSGVHHVVEAVRLSQVEKNLTCANSCLYQSLSHYCQEECSCFVFSPTNRKNDFPELLHTIACCCGVCYSFI